MFDHTDDLAALNTSSSLQEKLLCVHQTVQKQLPFVARIAIAVYDPKSGVLKTFLHSSGDENPLPNYQTQLDSAPSLKEILRHDKPRVVNNMVTFEKGESEHTRRIGRSGYAASYTMPMFYNGVFFGFLFFNSFETDVFHEENLRQLDIYGHMLSLMVINELGAIRTLAAAVKTTQKIGHARDPETGSHLDRMSRYARIIASTLSEKYQLDDSYIEHVFLYSPLHDIGKVGIPDKILLKAGPLTDEEREIMKTHSQKGVEMIDELIKNFGLEGFGEIDILRNIAESHHESMDGSGYPNGKRGKEIPLEARIVAVADVFDALTSRRPYKDAWTNAEAFALLLKLAGKTLDRECVDALMWNVDKLEQIQNEFREDFFG